MSSPTASPPPVPVDVTVICPVTQYVGDLAAVHREFNTALLASGRSAEFIYMVGADAPRASEAVAALQATDFPIRVFRLPRGAGESAALHHAFRAARGRLLLTIPDRFQADPAAVPRILDLLDQGRDVVVTRREPRQDAMLNRLQSRVFHRLAGLVSGQPFQDLTCGLRGLTREAALRVDLYGDLHRFIPILAVRMGARVEEIPVGQRQEDQALRLFGPGIYARRLLDLLNVFFLTRFLRKPLRFFGLVGMSLAAVGLAICLFLAVGKLMGSFSLADRPLLLLGVLLLVLGVQVTSIGLIGEIVIFLSSRPEAQEAVELEGDDA